MPQYPTHKLNPKRVILSLGGSLVVPDEINTVYLKKFRRFILDRIQQGWSFMIVVGGGAPARKYINAASDILENELTDDDKDWLGIHASRYNGHLLRTIFRQQAQAAIIINPEKGRVDETKSVVVAAGWKPGWSTDYVANVIAKRFHAPVIINLSNITQVYDADPRKNPQAKPINDMLWQDYRAMVGDKWTPGMNTPYDPIAARLAHKKNTAVLVMDGTNLKNLQACLDGQKFIGTMLHN